MLPVWPVSGLGSGVARADSCTGTIRRDHVCAERLHRFGRYPSQARRRFPCRFWAICAAGIRARVAASRRTSLFRARTGKSGIGAISPFTLASAKVGFPRAP
jgi:hypothetical protein